MKRLWPRTFLALLIILLSSSLQAQPHVGSKGQILGVPGKDVEVHFLYPAGRTYKYDSLFPVTLEYQNKTPIPQEFLLDWSLDREVPERYRSVWLEPGQKKRLSLIFPPRTVGNLYSLRVNKRGMSHGLSGNSQSPVTALLVPKGEDSLDYIRSLRLEKNPYYNATAPDQNEEFQPLQAVSSVENDEFPDHWALLESIDVLICYDLASLNLGTRQLEAIRYWVRRGGKLVLISNGIPSEFKDTPLEELLPLEIEGVKKVESALQVHGELKKKATVLYEGSEAPVLLQSGFSQGDVFFITSPIVSEETLGKDETEAVWRQIFDQAAINQQNRIFGSSILKDMPELPRAEAGWVALFVLLYGIIVGPVNLTLLRKRDKMLWSFATVPLVALIFAGSAYTLNWALRPNTPVTRELGVLSMQSGDSVGPTESEVLLFSPKSRNYFIQSDNKTEFSIFHYSYGAFYGRRQFEMYDQTADSGLRSHLELGTWDVARFAARSIVQLESEIQISVDEDKNSATISSPLKSDGATAVVCTTRRGVSNPFQLEKGTHTYDLTFKTNSNPTYLIKFDDDKNPGRQNLMSNRWHERSMQNMAANSLMFYTKEISTPLEFELKAKTHHDFLVIVGLYP